MTYDRAIHALKRASAIVTAFGLIMFLSLLPGLQQFFGHFLDFLHLPVDGTQGFSSDSELLLGAIGGGVITGLGVICWQVTTHVFTKDPQTGSRILKHGILSWFIIDSAGSILAGAWFNAVLNIGFLILFMAPLYLLDTDAKL